LPLLFWGRVLVFFDLGLLGRVQGHGIVLVENISVILQVAYFKYQKRKNGIEYARENRLFKMAPLHHHYQKKGYHEAKIVTRFWIVAIVLSVVTLVILKLQ
jgi:phospho-N-acetylmuramoyl-pentapeptide-transferase